MSMSLDVDIAALVGEMEEQACESVDHTSRKDVHDNGPATHYARVHCKVCAARTVIKAYCEFFVDSIRRDCMLECPDCHLDLPASALVAIVGPVRT